MQVEVVDSMPRPRLVYVEWIGVKSRLKDKANVTTHRPQLEQLFKVPPDLCVVYVVWEPD